MISKLCSLVFNDVIEKYHFLDTIEQPMTISEGFDTLSRLLYQKCWIDTVQWHMEDIIRNPEIDLNEGMRLKRRIDKSNQERTDVVEKIDDYFCEKYSGNPVQLNTKMNSETPAWLIDRLSILTLKIYHMKEEVQRVNASDDHRQRCSNKLAILREQYSDLMICLDDLINDIQSGVKRMKVYRQMKMYNDEELNPVLYTSKAESIGK